MSFKQLTIGIWSGNADGTLSVVTARGATLIQSSVSSWLETTIGTTSSTSLFILTLILHPSQVLHFPLLLQKGISSCCWKHVVPYNTTVKPYGLLLPC